MLLVIYFIILIIVYLFSDVVEKHVSNLFSDDDVNESYICQILKQAVIF